MAVPASARYAGYGPGSYQDANLNLYGATYFLSNTKLRVSKRAPDATLSYVKDIALPANYATGPFPFVKTDASGNLWVTASLTPTGSGASEIGVFKVSSTGTLLASKFYQPANSTGMSLAGFDVDGAGSPYITGHYHDTSSGNDVWFVVKYAPTLATGVARGLGPVGYGSTAYLGAPGDLVVDAAGNAYVSSLELELAVTPGGPADPASVGVVAKFDSNFDAAPAWQSVDALPGGNVGSVSLITLDASSRVTAAFDASVSDGTQDRPSVFIEQRGSTGTLNWTNSLGLYDMSPLAAIADASGNYAIVGAATNKGYTLAKVSGATGATLWSNAVAVAGRFPSGLAQDASGDYLAVYTATSGSTLFSAVDRLNGTTGTQTNYYTFSYTGKDYGISVYPSSVAGTFFVMGAGYWSSLNGYVPLAYRTGTAAWSYYQTMTTL